MLWLALRQLGRVRRCCFAILKLFHPSVIVLTLKRSLDICRCFSQTSRELWPGLRGVGTWEKWKGSGEGLLSHRRWRSDPVNSGIPPGLETRALSLCTPWALNECSQMVSASPAPPEHQAFCMHTYFTLKIAPSFLALLPSGGDYRINSSPPGRAMGNPLSSLSWGINNQ